MCHHPKSWITIQDKSYQKNIGWNKSLLCDSNHHQKKHPSEIGLNQIITKKKCDTQVITVTARLITKKTRGMRIITVTSRFKLSLKKYVERKLSQIRYRSK